MLEQRQRQNYGQALRGYLDHSAQENSAEPQYWQKISVRSVGQIGCIKLENVRWFSAAGNYVEMHLAARVVLHRQTISQLLNHLDPQAFMRVHRGAIVRIAQAQSLRVVGDGCYALRLECGDEVAVSERYVQQLRAKMG